MTISTTIIKNSYSGNGSTTAFTYNFKITDQDDIQVIIRSANGTETVKTITTHYTVGGVGGNSGTVTFTSGNIPVTGETVVLRRSTPQTQAMDLIDNDPMSADTIETAHDKVTSISQELQEQVDRSIKLSRTNTMTSTEFTVDATNRANKILAFDSSGEISVTQELGTFVGNWSASTSYNARDLVKDTSTNNIFICTTSHTSSGSQPLTTNTDSAKWSLIVDAASSTTAQTAAAASATASANSATASANSATASANSESAASTSETNAASSASTASTQATNSANSATASAGSAAAAAATFDLFDDAFLGAKSSNPSVDNDGNALQDGALYFDTTNDVMKVYNLSTTTWLRLTPTVTNQNNINSAVANASNINAAVANESNINAAVSNASNINSVVSNASNINTVAGIASNVTSVANNETNINSVNSNSSNINTVAGSITNVNNVGGSITNVNSVASNLASVNNFGEVYRIASSAPTTSLNSGDLYFDTTTNILNVYGASGWQNAGSSVNGTSQRYNYTATNGQTTFTGSDNNSNTLAYDAGFIDVYLNGVKLLNGTDVTVTSGSSVVLASGATTGDVVDIVAYGTFSVASLNADNLDSGTVPSARVSGAYTGITQTGTLTDFTSTGIDDNATSTAITIDSSENVGIGTSSPSQKLDVVGTIQVTNTANASNNSNIRDGGGLVIEAGNSNPMYFYTGGSEKMRIASSGNVGIGTNSPAYELDIVGSESVTDLRVRNDGTGAAKLRLSSGGTASSSSIDFGDDNDSNVGQILYFHNGNYLNFVTNAGARMRLNSGGDLTIGDTLTSTQPGLSNSTQAISLRGGSTEQFIISSASAPMFVNRTVDGTLISLRSGGNQEGSINVNGSSVTFNGFTGTHWSRFTDNSKPIILKGTVLETLDEMCDWYNLEFDVTDEEGNTYTQGVPHILEDGQSIGDTVAHTYEGTDYQATIVKEADIKHMKSKVSDTVDAKNVYGVFSSYDNDGDGYNDFYVASVGSFVVRIKANETIAKGDLLQSNGDGTAKVQSDDNIKSSSFAKVLSTTIIETYDDGSYLVPCSLMC